MWTIWEDLKEGTSLRPVRPYATAFTHSKHRRRGISLAEYYCCRADSIEPHRLRAEFRRQPRGIQLRRMLRFRAPAQP